MFGLEHKFCEVKPGQPDEGTLQGYASTKHEVDSTGDVILDGAYGDLAAFVQQGFVTVGHDHTGLPIGFVTEAKEDANGLWVAMKFHSTPEAQAVRQVATERLAAGKSVGLSIGYLPVEWLHETRAGKRVRVLKKIAVKEFSFVTVPAAQGAQATGVKSADLASLTEATRVLLRIAPGCLSEPVRESVLSVKAACCEALGESAAPEDVRELEIKWRAVAGATRKEKDL